MNNWKKEINWFKIIYRRHVIHQKFDLSIDDHAVSMNKFWFCRKCVIFNYLWTKFSFNRFLIISQSRYLIKKLNNFLRFVETNRRFFYQNCKWLHRWIIVFFYWCIWKNLSRKIQNKHSRYKYIILNKRNFRRWEYDSDYCENDDADVHYFFKSFFLCFDVERRIVNSRISSFFCSFSLSTKKTLKYFNLNILFNCMLREIWIDISLSLRTIIVSITASIKWTYIDNWLMIFDSNKKSRATNKIFFMRWMNIVNST